MKKYFVLCLVLLLLLSAVGCKNEVAPFSPNEEIPYVSYGYDIIRTYDRTPEDTITNVRLINLTSSGVHTTWGGLASGYDIVTSVEGLEDFAAACEANLRKYHDDYYLFPDEEEQPHQHPFSSRYLGSTEDLTFNETFFASQDLLIVDLCGYGFIDLVSRPETLEFQANAALITIQYGYRSSSTNSNKGNIFLIPVPKGCRVAQLEFVLIREWSDIGSDME